MDTSLPWIAVVDDEAPVRQAILRLLRAAGLPAHGFAGGVELLSAPMLQAPYCAVLDVQMPGMDGIELQRQLAARMPHCAVVVVTGSHSADTRARVMQGNPLAYLPKPAEAEQLLAAVASAWARRTHPH